MAQDTDIAAALRGFGAASTAEEVTAGLAPAGLAGRTYLLTGCNSGIGLETLRVLGLRGAHVIAAARTLAKAAEALARAGADGTPVACELSDPASVRACVAAVKATGRTLAGIIANAGIMALPAAVVSQGIELQLLTNHVGHFLLITGLGDALAQDGRVVVVSSAAHRFAPEVGIAFDDLDASGSYSPWVQYGQSKLANILFAKELARRWEGTGRTANSLHPGVIETNLQRHLDDWGAMKENIGAANFKSVPQGAATQVLLATHPALAGVTGRYFSDCQPAETTPPGRDQALQERLWAWTEEFVAGLG